MSEFDIIAREVSGYRARFEAIEKRLDEVEKVNARLEEEWSAPSSADTCGFGPVLSDKTTKI